MYKKCTSCGRDCQADRSSSNINNLGKCRTGKELDYKKI